MTTKYYIKINLLNGITIFEGFFIKNNSTSIIEGFYDNNDINTNLLYDINTKYTNFYIFNGSNWRSGTNTNTYFTQPYTFFLPLKPIINLTSVSTNIKDYNIVSNTDYIGLYLVPNGLQYYADNKLLYVNQNQNSATHGSYLSIRGTNNRYVLINDVNVIIKSEKQQQQQLLITNTNLNGIVGTPITLTTSGGSGTGLITYTISPNTYILYNNKLTITKAGIYTINAIKAQDDTYLDITSNTTMFTFEPMQTQLIHINVPIFNLKVNEKINISQYINQNNCIVYSSDRSIADIDLNANITAKKTGKFYIIVTNMSGKIVYTTPYFIEIY